MSKQNKNLSNEIISRTPKTYFTKRRAPRRTGVGTTPTFGYQTRFNLREGFPIVTTKRVPFRWIAEELFYSFLSGDTNEKAFARARRRYLGGMGGRRTPPNDLIGKTIWVGLRLSVEKFRRRLSPKTGLTRYER